MEPLYKNLLNEISTFDVKQPARVKSFHPDYFAEHFFTRNSYIGESHVIYSIMHNVMNLHSRFCCLSLGLFLTLFFSIPAKAQPSASEENLSSIFQIGTVQSLMIEKDNELVYEEFRNDIGRNTTTNIKSASKSILSLLVGIAIEEGFLEGTEQTLGEFFPGYFRENNDPKKEAITLRNLLTMQSGLETTSFHNYGRWVISDNWVQFVLDQPMEEVPGGKMVYSTGTSHLISVILTRETGMSTRQFAEQYLFGPMDIRIGGWDRDPQGYYMGGNNMAISPHALLKIGSLILNCGEYNGRQLVPASWVEDSVQIYTHSNYNDYDYGYMWWRRDTTGEKLIFAWGNGGQYIMVLPGKNAVISITSDVERSSGSRRYQRRIFQYLEDNLLSFLNSI